MPNHHGLLLAVLNNYIDNDNKLVIVFCKGTVEVYMSMGLCLQVKGVHTQTWAI